MTTEELQLVYRMTDDGKTSEDKLKAEELLSQQHFQQWHKELFITVEMSISPSANASTDWSTMQQHGGL